MSFERLNHELKSADPAEPAYLDFNIAAPMTEHAEPKLEMQRVFEPDECPASVRAFRRLAIDKLPERSLINGPLGDMMNPIPPSRMPESVTKTLDFYRLSRLGWQEHSSFIVDCIGKKMVYENHFGV